MGEAKRKRHLAVAPQPRDHKHEIHTRLVQLDGELLEAINDRLRQCNAWRVEHGQDQAARYPLSWAAFLVYVLAKNGLALFDQEYAAAQSTGRIVRTPEEIREEYRGRRTAMFTPPSRVR